MLEGALDSLRSSSCGDISLPPRDRGTCSSFLSKPASLSSPCMSVTETQKSISQAEVLWNEFGKVSSYGKIHLGNLCLHRASWNFAMHMNILKAFFFNW